MDKKIIIKDALVAFQKQLPLDILPRVLTLPTELKKIITVTGVRRSGKTSLLFDTINTLIGKGIPPQNILFYSFDDERISFTVEDFDLILQAWLELYPDTPTGEVYVFFDEMQITNGWEKFVSRVYNTFSKHLYLSGSNSSMLGTDIATVLRGRTLQYEVFPLNFAEYLQFRNIPVELHPAVNRARIVNEFDAFLQEGGFPEVALRGNLDFRKLIQNYYYVMLYRDIIERYGISNVSVLKYFVKRSVANLTKPFSINKIYNELRSAGLKADKNLLFNLSDHFEAIYFAFRLFRFDYSVFKQELTDKKQYFIDNGLINTLTGQLTEDKGKLLENAVYLWLRNKFGQNLFFYAKTKECDFVLFDRDKPQAVIQVCYDLSAQETKKREIEGLLEAGNYLKCPKLYIVTSKDEEEFRSGNDVIRVVTAWKLFLGHYGDLF
jgi:hypothetical protein